MAQNSQATGAARIADDGALVVSNRVSPGVPEAIIDSLLDDGIVGLVDYDIGPSLDKELLDGNNGVGRGTLTALQEFSRVGGYILAHKDGLDRIIAGRARPGSLRFEKVQLNDGSTKVLKCVQLDAYGEVKKGEFEGLDQLANTEGLIRHTFLPLDKDSRADVIEQIVSAVTVLERSGRLTYQ